MGPSNQSGDTLKGTIIQVCLCFVGNIPQLTSGLSLGFSAVALPYMTKEGSSVFVTKDQSSWIAGLAAITVPIGCLMSGPILDRWGRKAGLLLINVPFFIGWLLIAINPNLHRIYAGRALTGLGTGLASTPATIYFAEVATSTLRGFLISGTSIAISTGVLIVYILGYFFKENWQLMASVCALFPVVGTLLVSVLIPESPEWLLSKGKNDRASTALRLIRGVSTTKEIQQELDSMAGKHKSNRKNNTSLKEILVSFVHPQVYKPFVIMNLFFLFQQFSGIFVIIFYAVEVVRSSGIKVDPFLVSIMIGAIRLVFTIFAAWSSKRFGRRPTAIVSGFGMTISLFLLVIHLYKASNGVQTDLLATKTSFHNMSSAENATLWNVTDVSIDGLTSANELEAELTHLNSMNSSLHNKMLSDNKVAESTVNWLPLVSILVYVLSSTIGFLTLPWAMIGEVYPSEVRGVASGMTTCFAYITSFIAVKMYPLLQVELQQFGVFFIFGIMALLGTIFVMMFLPETQGKTLKEIELYFSKKGPKEMYFPDEEKDEVMMSAIKLPVIQSKENGMV